MFRRHVVFVVAATAFALAFGNEGCSHTDPLNVVTPPEEAGAPSLTVTDGGPAPEADAGLTAYCPATSCPAPLATCSSSRFQCDVDLSSDPNNCGECGVVCPQIVANATFTCIAGKCSMKCRPETFTADCNGLVDDDCEVALGTNENCNACGDTCSDPAKPCIFNRVTGKGRCGCEPGKVLCGSSCVDPAVDDSNCSACGIACDPAGGNADWPANGRFGCLGGQCGQLKCNMGFGDCDGDPSNGCEANLVTQDRCGSCSNACAPGKTCGYNAQQQIDCLCPTGQTLCYGRCVDVTTDPHSCGGCGVDCTTIAANQNNTVAFCSYGSCDYGCAQGWGDCDGDPKNGCEVNLNSDPKSCGTCGKSCDVLAGQPCVAGQCAVTPCTEGPTK